MNTGPRRLWLGGNWKMFKTIPEAIRFIRELKAGLPLSPTAEIILAPAFTALQAAARELEGSPVLLAAQDVHWVEEGAFTGEISTRMLLDAGCSYCIIGHSERRHWFHESDKEVHEKLKACLQAGLKPVFCVGETLEERENGQVREVIRRQVLTAVADFSEQEMTQGVIAYEPVWAIGTGKTASPEAAQEVQALIRRLIEEAFNKRVAMEKRIVYGGSVTPETIKALVSEPDIDGALVGGASLKAESFLALITEVQA
jgi:triosephosphate isomerase